MRAFGTATADTPSDALVQWLNGLDADAAAEAFARCCGAKRWVAGMVAARPFASRTHLHGAAEQLWWALGDGDWLEAFTHHPRIGADPDALRKKFGATADWSAGEQAGMQAADEATIQALAQGNRDYEARFGHIFIVCASGLTASTMLCMLQARMPNAPEFELRVAAGEQAKITALRLDKLQIP
jgi:2-oxo-4-hydroxy-4-carboxy-5-ureidoimidazoline decarboxylase